MSGATQQLQYLKNQGLHRSHRLLDLGCGSMRLGSAAAAFLDAGNYYGVDVSPWVLRQGYEHEIVANNLQERLPRTNLVATSDFDVAPPRPSIDGSMDLWNDRDGPTPL